MQHVNAANSITSPRLNLGGIDQFVRLGLATVMIGQMLYVADLVTWQPYLAFFGIYLVMTAMLGWDPIYKLLGLNSRREQDWAIDSLDRISSGILVSPDYARRRQQQLNDDHYHHHTDTAA